MTFQVPGNSISPNELTISRAIDLAKYVERDRTGCVHVTDCRRNGSNEIVCITAKAPDIPQRPLYDIRYDEQLALQFYPSPDAIPDVFSLRHDFPVTPHQNLSSAESPKSLCLFAEQAEDLNLKLTAALLVRRILWWLSGTAYGTLHQDDQPLEPLFAGYVRPLIIPSDLLTSESPEHVVIYPSNGDLDSGILVAEHESSVPIQFRQSTYSVLHFELPAQQHGIMHSEPVTLQALFELCDQLGYDFKSAIQRKVLSTYHKITVGTVILLSVPMKRSHNSPNEWRHYAFRCGTSLLSALVTFGTLPASEILRISEGTPKATEMSVSMLGKLLGLIDDVPGTAGCFSRLIPQGTSRASAVFLNLLSPQIMLERRAAAFLSGHTGTFDTRFVAVGLGALGSQVYANLSRQGYGTWVLVDYDYYAPHNAVRHAIMGKRFGVPKAQEMARISSENFTGAPMAREIVANVMKPGDQTESLETALNASNVILDMSGSGGVCRHLTLDVESNGLRISLFLTPSGKDLVLISEGAGRACRLDMIEAQYLRAVYSDRRLVGHLQGAEHTRYGGSCRDVTARMSQELVGLHSAVGARAVREAVASTKPLLCIWRSDPDRMTLKRISLPVAKTVVLTAADWKIIIDNVVQKKLNKFRSAALPHETCGILLGTFDMLHRHIYIADALPAPIDSIEEGHSCERGIDGLSEKINEITAKTFGQIDYVGEWHSHPDDVRCCPSTQDTIQMNWLKKHMHAEEHPALILIICEGRQISTFISEPATDSRN